MLTITQATNGNVQRGDAVGVFLHRAFLTRLAVVQRCAARLPGLEGRLVVARGRVAGIKIDQRGTVIDDELYLASIPQTISAVIHNRSRALGGVAGTIHYHQLIFPGGAGDLAEVDIPDSRIVRVLTHGNGLCCQRNLDTIPEQKEIAYIHIVDGFAECHPHFTHWHITWAIAAFHNLDVCHIGRCGVWRNDGDFPILHLAVHARAIRAFVVAVRVVQFGRSQVCPGKIPVVVIQRRGFRSDTKACPGFARSQCLGAYTQACPCHGDFVAVFMICRHVDRYRFLKAEFAVTVEINPGYQLGGFPARRHADL